MTPNPLRPLRWYEHWMLRFLVRSPRIDRIIVYQHPPFEYDYPDPELTPLDLWVDHLEDMYYAPAFEPREDA